MMLNVLVLLPVLAAVHASGVNLALKKEAFQSSTSSQGFAHLAVDGNLTTVYHRPCTQTAAGSNPWWVVDLGDLYTITRVKVLNREDCCARRLHDFNVGLLDESPDLVSPVPGNYNLCGTHEGEVPAGSWGEVSCAPNAYGRYVIIQIPGENEVLTLCEVEVFGSDCDPGRYTVYSSSTKKTQMQAKAVCKDNGGRLLYTTNSCQLKKLRDAINGTEIDHEPLDTWFWVGGATTKANKVLKDEDLPRSGKYCRALSNRKLHNGFKFNLYGKSCFAGYKWFICEFNQ